MGRRLQYVVWRWVKGNGMFNLSFRGHRAIVFNYFKICVVDIWYLATQCHLTSRNSHMYLVIHLFLQIYRKLVLPLDY